MGYKLLEKTQMEYHSNSALQIQKLHNQTILFWG